MSQYYYYQSYLSLSTAGLMWTYQRELSFLERIVRAVSYKLRFPKMIFTGQILPTCAVLQDASAPAQFERASSGDKDQGEETDLFSNDHP